MVGIPDGFCQVCGTESEISCSRLDGELWRVIRVDLPAQPVTAADAEEAWEGEWSSASEARRQTLQWLRHRLGFPSHFPVFDHLLRDDIGCLWVRKYRRPADAERGWLVVEDGRLIAGLKVPVEFAPTTVEGDPLAAVWLDDLGVEGVRAYLLARDWR
jgi:hypothetical protein